MTLNGHFTLNFVFAQVRLEFFCVDFDNDSVTTKSWTHTVSRKMFRMDFSFW